MKTDNNIWAKIDFSDEKEESAYDMLIAQSSFLKSKTKNELIMQIEAIDSYIDEEPPRLAALYMLYIVAPKLGNFRRKILTVAEYPKNGRFPVDIFSHLDNHKKSKVSKEKFIEVIEEILSRPIVMNSIKNLFKLSKNNISDISFPSQQANQ